MTSSQDQAPHGGNGRAMAADLGLNPDGIIDLSASLNPFAPDIETLAATRLRSLRRYPDHTQATQVAAEEFGVEADRLVLTNGGAEAIALVAQLLRRGSIQEPEFSLYQRHLKTYDEPNNKTNRSDGQTQRWRSNPNNPLGHLADPADKALVWDEAFYPLATGRWTRGDDSWRVGSLTKVWGCPGLRVGYVLAPTSKAAGQIARLQPRWSVNSLALALIPELFRSTELKVWADAIAELRSVFTRDLVSMGFDTEPSDANWVMVSGAPNLGCLTAKRGVFIRDCDSFGLPDTYRVALPTNNQFDRVLSVFEKAATH